MLAAPYYFSTSQRELAGYLQRLVLQLPLPVFLCNAPTNTRHALGLDLLRKLADLPNVRGVKDSGFDMIDFHKLIMQFRDQPEFTVLVGPQELTAEAVLLGGHGGMCGGSNIDPRLYVDMYKAAASGDLAALRPLHSRIIRISSTVYRVTREDSSNLRSLKCAVSLKGICSDSTGRAIRTIEPGGTRASAPLHDCGRPA